MNNHTPTIDENGKLIIPPIKQDHTSAYLHNVTQALNELNENKLVNQPWKVLAIGSKSEEEKNLDRIELDNHYSHQLIKDIDHTNTYAPEFAPNRTTSQYGSTSFYYLTENDLDSDVYITNIQFSIALAGYIPGEDEVEVGDIEYGVGELDEYKKPMNYAAKGLMKILKHHYFEDKKPHENITPYFIYRHTDTFYKKDDLVWPSPIASPNYFILSAEEAGFSSSEYPMTIDEVDNVLIPYTKPKNYAYAGLSNLLKNHYTNSIPHENLNPYFITRRPNTFYNTNEVVWLNNSYHPNYLQVTTEDGGFTDSRPKIDL